MWGGVSESDPPVLESVSAKLVEEVAAFHVLHEAAVCFYQLFLRELIYMWSDGLLKSLPDPEFAIEFLDLAGV